jgi:hypothetical protein
MRGEFCAGEFAVTIRVETRKRFRQAIGIFTRARRAGLDRDGDLHEVRPQTAPDANKKNAHSRE